MWSCNTTLLSVTHAMDVLLLKQLQNWFSALNILVPLMPHSV
jgi:hypothetical protein